MFKVKEDHNYNQKRYEALGEVGIQIMVVIVSNVNEPLMRPFFEKLFTIAEFILHGYWTFFLTAISLSLT